MIEAQIQENMEKLSSHEKGEYQEDLIEKLYRNNIFKNTNMIDIGASVGRHCIPMSNVAKTVYAFEPIPKLFKKLKKQCSFHPNLQIQQKALSNFEGTSKFYHVLDMNPWSGLKTWEYKTPQNVETIDVQVTSLDKEFSNKDISFIKIDAEGAEFDILKGGGRLLATKKPFVVFENGLKFSADIYDYTLEQFFNFFEAKNYRLYDIFGFPLSMGNWHRKRINTYVAIPQLKREYLLLLLSSRKPLEPINLPV